MFTNIYTQKHYIIKVDRMEVTLRYRVCVFHPHMVHWKWSSWLSRPFLFIFHCLRDTLSWSLPYCSGGFIETKTQHSTADTIHPNKHTHNGEEKFNYFKIGSASELWSIVDRVNIWNKKKIVINFQYPVVCGYARTRTHTHTHRHSSFDLNLYNVTEKHSHDDAHMRDLRANEAHLNLRLLLQIYYNAVNAHMWRMIELS